MLSHLLRGLSQISKRCAKTNNKYMSNYDKSSMDSYILYLDANNVHVYAMCEYLPQGILNGILKNGQQLNFQVWMKK